MSDDTVKAEDATYENEIAQSRTQKRPVRIPAKVVLNLGWTGPRAHLGTARLWPPMSIAIRESSAWCDHVDRVRLDHYLRQVAAFKIRY